jgi:hypothetical protein
MLGYKLRGKSQLRNQLEADTVTLAAFGTLKHEVPAPVKVKCTS